MSGLASDPTKVAELAVVPGAAAPANAAPAVDMNDVAEPWFLGVQHSRHSQSRSKLRARQQLHSQAGCPGAGSCSGAPSSLPSPPRTSPCEPTGFSCAQGARSRPPVASARARPPRLAAQLRVGVQLDGPVTGEAVGRELEGILVLQQEVEQAAVVQRRGPS